MPWVGAPTIGRFDCLSPYGPIVKRLSEGKHSRIKCECSERNGTGNARNVNGNFPGNEGVLVAFCVVHVVACCSMCPSKTLNEILEPLGKHCDDDATLVAGGDGPSASLVAASP